MDSGKNRVHSVKLVEPSYKKFVPYAALLVSILTAITIIWQGFEMRNHYRKIVQAQVTTYTTNTVQEENWGIFLQNEGVGPAIITLEKMLLDGTPTTPVDILNQMVEEEFIKKQHPAVRRIMGEELVLKEGARTPILVFKPKGVNPAKIDEFEKLINHRINLEYTWCSVYEKCVSSCTAVGCKMNK